MRRQSEGAVCTEEGDALTLSYAVNGTAILGAFHEAWDLDFCSLHRTSWA